MLLVTFISCAHFQHIVHVISQSVVACVKSKDLGLFLSAKLIGVSCPTSLKKNGLCQHGENIYPYPNGWANVQLWSVHWCTINS